MFIDSLSPPNVLRACSNTMLWIFATISFVLFSNVYGSESNPRFHFVWQACPDGWLEGDWIREVFADVDHDEIVDRKYSVFVDNSIIVVEGSQSEKYLPYFNSLHAMGYKFGVVVLSDETTTSSTVYYPEVKFVLRNYWRTEYEKYKNVRPIPLGYARGFWKDCADKTIKPASERKYNWAFAGEISGDKPTRSAMYQAMMRVPQGYVHTVSYFYAPDCLPKEQYRTLLLDTIFAPASMGYCSQDTFRIYEALESGCIPIVEKFPSDYFANLFGSYPFLSVNSWDEAPVLINELLADPVNLENLRAKCYQWWLDYKKQLKQDLGTFIEEQMAQ